jgi:hypothetical protein
MPVKALPTKPLRVIVEIHAAVKLASAKTRLSMQQITEDAISHWLSHEYPKEPGWKPDWRNTQ